jgi:DNA-binding response OmpR family regulator
MALDILVQILVGFGAKDMLKAQTVEEAKEVVLKAGLDLMIVGTALGDGDGYQLVEWVRREGPAINRFVPLLMLTGHMPQSDVAHARDCGAHFIIVKPLKPAVLLERILWVARAQRKFVECESYAGPDRRFKFEGPPPGASGRRHDDLNEEIGLAVEPNMSQDQIDALINGKVTA